MSSSGTLGNHDLVTRMLRSTSFTSNRNRLACIAKAEEEED